MLQADQVLHNRYRLNQKLGQNAGRQTWLAEDEESQPPEPVVVKLLAFGEQVHWDYLKLFEREAQVLKQLQHPQIPRYRDYFSIDDRTLWFGSVQDYIPGASLKELLNQGERFTEAGIRRMAIEVLQILIYLHELNPPVLHRDIKPSNLILSEENRVYLIDFGAVQDRASKEGATFTVVGTYGYVPLEQFGGRAVPSSDLYALGATLVHLLTGIPPADLPQRDLRIQFSDRLSLNPNLVSWIKTLIEPDVNKRFSTARQALNALPSSIEILSNPSCRDSLQSASPAPGSRIQRPEGTRITIRKSDDELLIQQLSPEKKALQTMETMENEFLWLSIITTISPIVLILLFKVPLVTLIFLFTIFFSTRIFLFGLDSSKTPRKSHSRISTFTIAHINRSKFLIHKDLYRSIRRPSSGATSSIINVVQDIDKSAIRTLTIVTTERDHLLVSGLSEAESMWLVHEIKDWLGLR